MSVMSRTTGSMKFSETFVAQMARRFRLPGVLALAACAASTGSANAEGYQIDDGVERFANQALATFGLVAVPDQSASAVSLKSTGVNGNEFFSGQIGGGFRVSDDVPLYLEGYLGFQRYDPQVVISDGVDSLEVRAYWNGFAATGGVGWDFRFDENWSLRPIANFSLGRIASDLSIGGAIVEDLTGEDLDFLINGGMHTGGYGGSLMLKYELRSREMDLDFSARHTHMRLVSIGSTASDAKADAITSAVWGRARIPIKGWKMMGSPVRSVWEGSLSAYPGDQGKLLGVDWLGRIGAGLELDTSRSGFKVISRARFIVRYVFGDGYTGYSVGLGVSF